MKLPAILKFSHLSRILVFYGYLHEWKVLLERLCKLTKKLWENNLKAFIKVGENHKAQMLFEYVSQRMDSFVSNLDYNYNFIKCFYMNNKSLKYSIPYFTKVLSQNKLIFVNSDEEAIYEMETDDEDNLSDPLDKIFYRVLILLNEEASIMIPVINCPSFKHEYLDVDSNRLWKLLSDLKMCWLLLAVSQGKLKYQRINHQTYHWLKKNGGLNL